MYDGSAVFWLHRRRDKRTYSLRKRDFSSSSFHERYLPRLEFGLQASMIRLLRWMCMYVQRKVRGSLEGRMM